MGLLTGRKNERMSYVTALTRSDCEQASLEKDDPSLVTVLCDLCGTHNGERVLEKFGVGYSRCSKCGFVYACPRLNEAALYNEKAVSARLNHYIAKAYSSRKQRSHRNRLQTFEKYRQTNRILEIGASVGGFLYQAGKQGWNAVGVEPVNACASFGRNKHNLNIIPNTLEQAGLAQNSFDVVFSNAVLEHLESPSRVLQEVFKLLRPGGIACLRTVNYESYTKDFIGSDWKLIDPRAHLSLFTPRTLREACEKSGLRVLRIRTDGVRFRPNGDKLHGLRRKAEKLRKLPFRVAARITLKGDRVEVLAYKPY